MKRGEVAVAGISTCPPVAVSPPTRAVPATTVARDPLRPPRESSTVDRRLAIWQMSRVCIYQSARIYIVGLTKRFWFQSNIRAKI